MRMKRIGICLLVLCVMLCFINSLAEGNIIADGNSPSSLLKYDDEAYSIVVFDEAKLLNEDEISNVVDMMRQVSVYANVGFVSYPAGGSNENSATKAMNWGNNQFGSDAPFVVFIIDMTNRHLDIYASKPLAEVLNSAVLNSITDNTYRYASRGEYSDCIIETFRLVENVLKDEEWLSGQFLFRDKIRWGMSVNEVTSLETGDYVKTESNDLQLLSYENVPISKYHGYLGYAFSSNALVFCMYGIEDPDGDMPYYLKTALDKVYGEGVVSSAREVYGIMQGISGDLADETEYDDNLVCKWTYSDGTRIILAKEAGFMYIMYVSPEFTDNYLEKETEEVVTTGL